MLLPNSTQHNTTCPKAPLNALLTKFSIKILLRGAFKAWPQPLGAHTAPQIQTVSCLSIQDLKNNKILETYHMHEEWAGSPFFLLSCLLSDQAFLSKGTANLSQQDSFNLISESFLPSSPSDVRIPTCQGNQWTPAWHKPVNSEQPSLAPGGQGHKIICLFARPYFK